MKAPLSWIRELVDVPGTPDEIGARLSLRGLALEGLERHGDDTVLDFDVTANRPDCLSIQGLAREIATVYSLPLGVPVTPRASDAVAPQLASGTTPTEVGVAIEDPDLCRRYVAAVAEVDVGPSPAWMQDRLVACGVRPISNVVDITNYVLLELGHPLHAFDLARLRGPEIVVRRAREGEGVTTLDGKRRMLERDMLVIADAESAQAVGGVMGGADSEVSPGTRAIVLESAWFTPQSVRATSKRLGLRTEASYRFERGADLTAPDRAMARALALLDATGAGRARGPMVDCYPVPFEPRDLTIDSTAVERLLGMHVPDMEIERILRSLGFGIKPLGGWHAAAPEAAVPITQAAQGWQVTVPAWRVDISRSVDLIEEIGRHHGFEHLPTTFPAVEQAPRASDSRVARDGRARRGLLAMGFSEAITFAVVEASAAAPFLEGQAPVALANPLSENFTTLRPSLLPGLIDAVSHNRRHGRRDVRLFEIGTRFSPAAETRGLAAVWTGIATPDHWGGSRRDADFFDMKGAVEQLAAVMGATPSFTPTAREYLVDGRAAGVGVSNHPVGVVGQLLPSLAEARGLPAGDAVYALEVDLDRITAASGAGVRLARPLPRHPSVVRDVAILIDGSLSAETVRGTIRASGPATLVEVREFDRYQGKGIPDGKISVAFRLSFQAPDRTLTDIEIHAAMDRIVAALGHELGAIQR
jgi:phenylalanyl-tRNA synthetase beta chain